MLDMPQHGQIRPLAQLYAIGKRTVSLTEVLRRMLNGRMHSPIRQEPTNP